MKGNHEMSREDLDRQLAALRTNIADLAQFVDALLDRALTSVVTGDGYDARIALSREDEFDHACETVEEQAVTILTLQQPVLASDLRLVVATLVVAQRLQRVGHNALGVAGLAVDLADLGPSEPPPALLALARDARGMLHDAMQALLARDGAAADQVVARDTTIDRAYRALRDELLAQNASVPPDETLHRRLTFWIWIAHKLERVADHAVVIARRARQMGT
jgi:phosphate transport system protein